MPKWIVLLFAVLVFGKVQAFLPDAGIVPTKEVAVKVAEAVLPEIYGKSVLDQRPFNAVLRNGIWHVDGTFHCPQGNHCLGGTAHIEIQKKDGLIKHVEHGK